MAAANSSTVNRIQRSRSRGHHDPTQSLNRSITWVRSGGRGAEAGPQAVAHAGAGLDHVVAAQLATQLSGSSDSLPWLITASDGVGAAAGLRARRRMACTRAVTSRGLNGLVT